MQIGDSISSSGNGWLIKSSRSYKPTRVVLTLAQKYGEIQTTKIENMKSST